MNDTSETIPSYDAGNQRHVDRRRKAANVERLQADEALRWLMADARGRRFVWGQLSRAGLFHSSMAATPELTAFNEGRRDIGLTLLSDVMRLSPEGYARMQAEATSRKPTSTGETDDGRDDADA
ncbi:MAG: hypothetical protein JSR47_11465 [Proteobacteria bacterium]|nr:hypothetical protein [Pseudomonadota bacterium]MBS0547728.1 hypothetical protein [Pseudomonadota bacterium]